MHIGMLIALLQVCAYNMPPVELEGLREIFESIDKSHSGTISLEELTSHLQVNTVFTRDGKAHVGLF